MHSSNYSSDYNARLKRVLVASWILVALGLTALVAVPHFISNDAKYPYNYSSNRATIRSNNITTFDTQCPPDKQYCSHLVLQFTSPTVCMIQVEQPLERLIYQQEHEFRINNTIAIYVQKYHADQCLLSVEDLKDALGRDIALYIVVLFFGFMLGLALTFVLCLPVGTIVCALWSWISHRSNRPVHSRQEDSESYQLMVVSNSNMY